MVRWELDQYRCCHYLPVALCSSSISPLHFGTTPAIGDKLENVTMSRSLKLLICTTVLSKRLEISTATYDYLQYSFGESGFLRQLLQILRIWVLVDGEVCLHRPQLVMFERRAHSLRPLWLLSSAGSWRSYRRIVRQWIHGRGQVSLLEHFCKYQSNRITCMDNRRILQQFKWTKR